MESVSSFRGAFKRERKITITSNESAQRDQRDEEEGRRAREGKQIKRETEIPWIAITDISRSSRSIRLIVRPLIGVKS